MTMTALYVMTAVMAAINLATLAAMVILVRICLSEVRDSRRCLVAKTLAEAEAAKEGAGEEPLRSEIVPDEVSDENPLSGRYPT